MGKTWGKLVDINRSIFFKKNACLSFYYGFYSEVTERNGKMEKHHSIHFGSGPVQKPMSSV